MNKNMEMAVLGVSLVVLGYALLQHFRNAAPGSSLGLALGDNFKQPTPAAPANGFAYDPYNPADIIPADSFIRGTIRDYNTNTQAGYEIPFISGLIDSVLGETYGTDANKSVVFK